MKDERITDMHVHSSASDGTLSPAELLREAKRAGLSAMALTDHDTMDGVAEAQRAADGLGIELIPGVELSTDYGEQEVHVLGYYPSPENPGLEAQMRLCRDFRVTRNERMVQKLQETGFSITMEELGKHFGDSVITRAHMARYLFETGQIPDIKTAFAKYIGDNCPCYIERPKITPVEAVTLIKKAGGVAVLAHPVLLPKLDEAEIEQMITEMKEAGLAGIEAIYSENTKDDETHFRKLAEDMGLAVTGGSDFHGANKPDIRLSVGKGNLRIPYALAENIRNIREAEAAAGQ